MNKITVKLSKDGLLIPTCIYDKQLLLNNLKVGECYQAKLTKPRNAKHNSKYWLLLGALAFHFGSTAEFWHEDCKNAFLPKQQRTNKLTGEVFDYISSTAFDKLDQSGFDEYYKQLESHLNNQGYNVDELISTS